MHRWRSHGGGRQSGYATQVLECECGPRPASWYRRVAEQYVADLQSELSRVDTGNLALILAAISATVASDRVIFLAGNGGSATTATHIASDWSAAMAARGKRGLVINLADNIARLTALSNDVGYQEVFSRQLLAAASPGDLLVVISVSGTSPNIVRAVDTARAMGMRCIGLLGSRGAIAHLCTHALVVGRGDYGLAEDLHLAFNHLVVRALHGEQVMAQSECLCAA